MQKNLYGMLFLFFALNLLSFFQVSYANPFTIDKIVVFGDSLSDNGNLYNATKEANQKNNRFPIIPKTLSYYQGRFSNGQVWVEDLAQSLNVPLVDYAYGGAWAEAGENPLESRMPMPSLNMQINAYLLKNVTRDADKSQHLYVIWVGANDYMFNFIPGRTNIDHLTSHVVAFIQNQIELLMIDEAKNFLVLNLPDFSNVPSMAEQGPDIASKMGEISLSHNSKLNSMLVKLREQYPESQGYHFIQANVETYFNEAISNPAQYGLTNVKQACYPGGNMGYDGKPFDLSCTNPDSYMFWDKLHPTRAMHAALANRVLNELQIAGMTVQTKRG